MKCNDCGKVLIRFIPSGGFYAYEHYVTLEGESICPECKAKRDWEQGMKYYQAYVDYSDEAVAPDISKGGTLTIYTNHKTY